jgi:PAS domain S-box-containing protein
VKALFAPDPITPEQRAELQAAREDALHHIIRGVIVVALIALIGYTLTAFVYGTWSSVALYGGLFATLLVLALIKRMPLALRGGIFVSLLYAVALVSNLTIGIGSAGRVFLIGFVVLVTIIFGTRAGIGAVLLSLATWFGFAIAYTAFGMQAPAPNDSAVFVDWVSAGASLLLIIVALMIPQRQFLEIRLKALTTSREMAELEAAQKALAAQAHKLETVSREALEANQRLAVQSRTLERRAGLLALNAEVAQAAAAGLHDLSGLLHTSVHLIGQGFGFYHAGIFLLDDAGEWAVLRAANSPGGQRMLARGHRLRVGQEGIVGHVAATGRARIALDVGDDAVHFANPDLAETRSELAVPLRARGNIIGALDVQSSQPHAFTDEDARVLQSLADQIGLAIDNARLFQQTEQRLAELQSLQSQARREAGPGGGGGPLAYRYDGIDIRPASELPPPPDEDALQVPLTFGGQVLGSLQLQRQGEPWSDDDLELASAVADRMALALESAQAFEATRARAQQLAALSEVAIDLTGPQTDIGQALERIAGGALKLFEAGSAGVWLPAGPDEIELRVTAGPGVAGAAGRRLARGEGLAGQAFVSRQSVRAGAEAAGAADGAFSAALFVPMQWQSRVLGVLAVMHSEPGRGFTPGDEQIAQLFAAQAASTLENARLFAETRQRLSELAAINTISTALTAHRDLSSLLRVVGENIFKTFGVPNGFIALYDAATETIEFPYFMEAGGAVAVAPRPLGQGISSVVIQTRQPLLIRRNAEQRLAELGALTQGAPARSWLGVPITAGEQVLGVISVQDLEHEEAFTEADARLLATIASSVGVAIENVRLFDQTQQRAEELAAINSISQALAQHLELRAMSELVVERLCDVFDVSNAYLALFDRQTGTIEIPYMLDAGQRMHIEPFPLGRGLTSVIIQQRAPLLINQDAQRAVTELGAITTGKDARSFLGVPVMAGDEVLGVISVQDLERENRFSQADVGLLTTIASNVGVALQNARLFEQTQARAAELAVVNELARAISQQLEPTQVLQTVYEQVQRITPLDGFFVTLYDHESGLQSTPLIYEAGRRSEEAPRPLPSVGLIRQVIDTGQHVLINRTAEEVQQIALSPERAMVSSPQVAASLLYLPLHFGQQVGGVMSVQSYSLNAYGERHVAVLTAVANHVVVALQNARLFEETQRRAEQLATASEIAQATISVLNPDELVVRAVELIRDRFERSAGVNYAGLFLVDEGGQVARLRHATGQAGRVLLERGHFLEVGGSSMVGWATAHRRARLALDVGAEPVRFANPLLPNTRSELALPLVVGDTVLGALDVQATKSAAFNDADVAVLQTMADQIAIALRNAQLLADTQRTQALLDSIIENLPVMLSVRDAHDLRIVRWNRAGEELLGLSREAMLGKSDYGYLAEAESDAITERDREVLAGRAMLDIPEEPVVTADQRRRLLHTRKVPIVDETGQPRYLLGISEDITERREAELRLQAAEERYRTLVEQLPAIIYAVEVPRGQKVGRTTYISPQVQTLLGFTPEEWLADTDLWVKLLHPADREGVLAEVARQNAIGTALDVEYRSLTRDGRVVWLHNQSQAQEDPLTGNVHTQGIMFDITARKQAEAALMAAQETAQRRAQLLAAAAEIARTTTASLDRDELLRTSVELIRDRFGFYHASVFMVEPGSNMAVLRESTGDAGEQLKARRHQLAVGSRSLVGTATASRQPVIVQDVLEDPNHYRNPLLPDTRAEAVIPLLSGETVVGALDVQSNRPNAFGPEDIAILMTISDQLAVALQNARLFDQTARQARRERLVVDITSKIRSVNDMDSMLRIAVDELRRALGVSHAAVRLDLRGQAPPAAADEPGADGAGNGRRARRPNGGHGLEGHDPGAGGSEA